jgi:hypothetical protein
VLSPGERRERLRGDRVEPAEPVGARDREDRARASGAIARPAASSRCSRAGASPRG